MNWTKRIYITRQLLWFYFINRSIFSGAYFSARSSRRFHLELCWWWEALVTLSWGFGFSVFPEAELTETSSFSWLLLNSQWFSRHSVSAACQQLCCVPGCWPMLEWHCSEDWSLRYCTTNRGKLAALRSIDLDLEELSRFLHGDCWLVLSLFYYYDLFISPFTPLF